MLAADRDRSFQRFEQGLGLRQAWSERLRRSDV
jgi:hypothetical protein